MLFDGKIKKVPLKINEDTVAKIPGTILLDSSCENDWLSAWFCDKYCENSHLVRDEREASQSTSQICLPIITFTRREHIPLKRRQCG